MLNFIRYGRWCQDIKNPSFSTGKKSRQYENSKKTLKLEHRTDIQTCGIIRNRYPPAYTELTFADAD